jgi:hypothetical protein
VLQECAPTLRAQAGANWRDPESEHTRASFSGMFPSAIVDQLCKQGGPGGIPWTFRVYRDRLVYFGPAITGTEPGYRLAFDDTVEWDEDADDMYGSAFVTYTDGGVASSTDVASNSAFAGQWNLDRLIARNVGDMPLTAAILARDTVLAEGAAPRVAAKITLPGWDGLPRPGMAPHPGYLIHAVDTVQIGEEPLQRLIGTGFDWRTGALSLTLGEPARDDVRVQLRQLREDRKRSEQGLHVHGGRLPALRQQAAVGALVDSSGGAADGTLQPLAPVTNSTGGTSTGALVDVRLVPVMTNSTGSVANDVLSALSSITTLTDSTGGTANNALESVGASYSQTVVRNNFADLAAKVNALIAWGTTISANDAETAQLSADTRTALAAVNDDLARLAAAHNAALATINDNVADLAAQVSSLRAALRGARLLP